MIQRSLILIFSLSACAVAAAQQPSDFMAAFSEQAARENLGFNRFDAADGERFFKTRHGDWSCASCHTENPIARGKHAVTAKVIAPLAPGANPERFTDSRKVDKWFRRNCNDVLGRACTAREKGDVLAYLLSLGR